MRGRSHELHEHGDRLLQIADLGEPHCAVEGNLARLVIGEEKFLPHVIVWLEHSKKELTTLREAEMAPASRSGSLVYADHPTVAYRAVISSRSSGASTR